MIEVPETLIDTIAKELGIVTMAGRLTIKLSLENAQLMDRKQLDYGPMNIAFGGESGVVVRSFDKLTRLQNLLSKKRRPKNESIEDSYRDLANYAFIGIMLHKGTWPMTDLKKA